MKTKIPGTIANSAFSRLVSIGTALGFAGMTGSIACLSHGPRGRFILDWSAWALPLGAIGFVLGLLFWRLLWQAEAESDPNHPGRRRLIHYSILLALVAFGCFLYPIRFVDPARRQDVFQGLAMAIVILSFIGFLILKVVRGVSSDEPQDGQAE